MKFSSKPHWENIYGTKTLQEVSWYQPVPHTSLDLILSSDLPKTAAIVDAGGGDSLLADHLLEAGYVDITVLDISEVALERARMRLGDKAGKIRWIAADIASYEPDRSYDLWHDRAAFHFLTQDEDIRHYLGALSKGIVPGGVLLVATFSENGPEKCSGIPIKQYSEASMKATFSDAFDTMECFTAIHPTPFGTTQEFTFCSFRRK